MKLCIVLALVLIFATSAFALEKKAFKMKEDFGGEQLYDVGLRNYYHMPCPIGAGSWYWIYSGWDPGDIIGQCFTIGAQGTGGWDPADPAVCHELESIRTFDYAGYGTVYPGLFTFEFDVYCGAEECCYAAPLQNIWNSGPLESHFGWNYIDIDPPLCLSDCAVGPPYGQNYNVIVTMTFTGTEGLYPAPLLDNPSSNILDPDGCLLHDYGCLPMIVPRYPCGSGLGNEVHSGFVGTFPFEYWPMDFFCDGADTTPDCSQYGAIELAWTLYLVCGGPTATEPSSWGNIKSMYR